jgi:hypothetical protein
LAIFVGKEDAGDLLHGSSPYEKDIVAWHVPSHKKNWCLAQINTGFYAQTIYEKFLFIC